MIMALTFPGKYNLAFNPSIWNRFNGKKVPSSYPSVITMSELWESGSVGMAVARGSWGSNMRLDGISIPQGLKLVSGWHVGRLLENDWNQEVELVESQAKQLTKSGAQVIIDEESPFDDILVGSSAGGNKILADKECLEKYCVNLSHFGQYLLENYGLRLAYFTGTLSAIETKRAMQRLSDLSAPSVGFAIDADCLGDCESVGGVDQPALLDRIAHMFTNCVSSGIGSTGQDKVFRPRVRTALYYAGIQGDIKPIAVPKLLNVLSRTPYKGWVVDQAVMVR